MFKLLLLDFNVIGIILSFVNDNFGVLYYLKENNIKPYYKEINWNTVNWNELSNNIDKYDISIIDEFKDYINWNYLTIQKMDNQDFLTKYIDYVNFDLIHQKMKFSYTIEYSFYEEHSDKFDWLKLSRWADMAEDFIDLFHDRLDWNILSRTQGLTEYILNKYFNKLILTDIRYNYHIEIDLKNNIIARLEEQERQNNDIENEETNSQEEVNREDIDEDIEIIIQ